MKLIYKVFWWFCKLILVRNTYTKKYTEKLLIKYIFKHWHKIAIKEREKYNMQKPRLLWTPIPILNFKYWSNAMKEIGYDSCTLMQTYYGSINKKSDYDLYFEDIVFEGIEKYLYNFNDFFPEIKKLLLVCHVIRNYDIINISFEGGVLCHTNYWREELAFYKNIGIKIVVLPYGADHYRYSTIYDKSWHHGLLQSYPQAALAEKKIQQKVDFLVDNSDCIMAGFQFDNLARWDILPYAIYPMDCTLWQKSTKKDHFNGKNGVVKVTHTPNHRGVKGTEFIIQAVKELQEEGLQVELILIEKKQNEEVRQIMETEADIHVEQLLLSYALSGIEGMASALPVLACLDNEIYTRVFRRFSYLNECPILNTTPENIKNNLRILIKNPDLRQDLGKAGRDYAIKYHSFQTMQYIFNNIYDKIWHKKEVDLMNMFHPLNPKSYNNQSLKIEHPLIENKIPLELLTILN